MIGHERNSYGARECGWIFNQAKSKYKRSLVHVLSVKEKYIIVSSRDTGGERPNKIFDIQRDLSRSLRDKSESERQKQRATIEHMSITDIQSSVNHPKSPISP